MFFVSSFNSLRLGWLKCDPNHFALKAKHSFGVQHYHFNVIRLLKIQIFYQFSTNMISCYVQKSKGKGKSKGNWMKGLRQKLFYGEHFSCFSFFFNHNFSCVFLIVDFALVFFSQYLSYFLSDCNHIWLIWVWSLLKMEVSVFLYQIYIWYA